MKWVCRFAVMPDGLLREEEMKKTRQANLELLRIFAMVMVVTAHLVNHGNMIYGAQPGPDGLLREEEMKKTRQANLELLRIFAMVMVVTAHLVNHGNMIYGAQPGTASYYVVWTLFGVSFVCINVYLLISSYFLVESRFSLWKLVKMVVQVFFYAFGITLIFWLFTDVPHELKYMVYSVLPVSSDFYWFVSMYVGFSGCLRTCRMN